MILILEVGESQQNPNFEVKGLHKRRNNDFGQNSLDQEPTMCGCFVGIKDPILFSPADKSFLSNFFA